MKRSRRALFVDKLANNLIVKEKMQTTEARAKEIRPLVERMVTIAKHQSVAGLRLLLRRLPKQSAEKLFYDIAPKYKERKGGYLRIIKLAKSRKRDGAPVARIEFV